MLLSWYCGEDMLCVVLPLAMGFRTSNHFLLLVQDWLHVIYCIPIFQPLPKTTFKTIVLSNTETSQMKLRSHAWPKTNWKMFVSVNKVFHYKKKLVSRWSIIYQSFLFLSCFFLTLIKVVLSPVYTAQTNPGSTWLCSNVQKPKTPVNTNLGRTRVNFSHAGQLVAFTGEVIIFRNQVCCFVNFRWHSRQTRP